ncbi:MAG: hypothetical protein PQ612_10575 [Rickettsiales bacterium]|nr:hypothetical protein [Pseudomonadota bacterium]MDA0966725.1 hypothetical protein [Pseudomonadota bacterium]MDG4544490.1 hypothetical protein [Rickettsiales bacterium]MDG4546595.1 hypothetical protein [Rickettsiales bacterium]MDG4548720.1 hypothetical protein [Rickettsiales bacterium]
MVQESGIAEEIIKRPVVDIENEEDAGLSPINGDSYGTEYQIGKSIFLRINCSDRTDIVFGRYKINTKQPLKEFDTALAKAYEVTDIIADDSTKYYALTLHRHYPARIIEINKLLGKNINNFANIIAAQVIKTSLDNGRFFTVIIEKPEGIKLSDFLEKNGSISEEAVISKITAPISKVINLFEKLSITHGRVNLDNVYINKNGSVTLGECISEPCGYSQPMIYESISRASTTPIGKGKGVPGLLDFHAIGVMSAFCLRGKNPYSKTSDKLILDLKYSKNTYRMVTDGIDITPYMSDFLRGSINENIKQTWNAERMREWLGGRRYNLLPPTENIDAGRPILFNNKRFLSKKHLAYAMYQDWDLAKKFLKDSTLIRWIERSVQDVKLSEKMEILGKRFGSEEADSTFTRDDEMVAQYIMLLDSTGPIRVKQVSVNIDAIGSLLAESFYKSDNDCINAISNIIKHSLASYKDFDKSASNLEKEDIMVMQRCSELFRKKYEGFGIERMLYELNSEMPCQSELLKNSYACSIPDLFEVLQDKPLNNNNFDLHLTSFIAAKLELPVKLRIKSLSKFPDMATHKGIENLAMLSVAQQTFKVKNLPKLCANIGELVTDAVETFHNRFIRDEIISELEKITKKGNITNILSLITDRKYILKDRIGFRRAVLKYRNNTIQISKLNNKQAVNNMGYLYGLQLSVILTFFMATIVVIILILKVF